MNDVAVLLSYYKGAEYIEDQINSILAQTYNDLHLFIRVDGNADEGVILIEMLISKGYPITLFKENNLGVIESFYDLLLKIEGYKYYAFCDQDDFWLPNKLENAVLILNQNLETPSLYCSAYKLTDQHLNEISFKTTQVIPSFENALFKNFCTGCTCVINSKLREKLIKNFYNINVPMHDWWFLLVAYSTGVVLYDDRKTILYRQHGNNVVGGIDTLLTKLKRYMVTFISGDNSRYNLASSLLNVKDIKPDVKLFLQQIKSSKHSFRTRLKVVFSNKFTYYKFLDRLSVRLSILFGRF